MVYENENFTVSQDRELPIKGLMIISPKKHIHYLSELTDNERNELFYLVNRNKEILKKNDVADTFVVMFDERSHVHLHVCIIPKYDWMKSLTDDIAGDLKKVMNYSQQAFTSKKDYAEIKAVSDIVRENLNSK